MQRFKITIINLICSLLFTGITYSTIIERMDNNKLIKKADKIIIGEVQNIECEWDNDYNMIHTYVTINVLKWIKGEGNSTIQLLFPGGEVENKIINVDLTPSFELHQKAILFLEPEIKNTYRVLGWLQGKFTIIEKTNTILENNQNVDAFLNMIKSKLNANKTKG